MVKFIYSEKATKFCEIFTLLLTYVVTVKSKVKILQNFVSFSEYMDFMTILQKVNEWMKSVIPEIAIDFVQRFISSLS